MKIHLVQMTHYFNQTNRKNQKVKINLSHRREVWLSHLAHIQEITGSNPAGAILSGSFRLEPKGRVGSFAVLGRVRVAQADNSRKDCNLVLAPEGHLVQPT